MTSRGVGVDWEGRAVPLGQPVTGGRDARRWGRWRVVAIASVAVLVATTTSALASDSFPRLVAPGSYGTVDFGDRVGYELMGPGCEHDAVVVRVTTVGGQVTSAASTPLRDPLAATPDACAGVVTVPAERAVRGMGWQPGEPLSVTVASGHSSVPLRYERVELGQGKAAAGSPALVISHDARSGPNEKAMSMSTGDAVDIGRVDLSKISSISLRTCITAPKPHVPTEFELRAGSPTGPAVVGPVDVADDFLNDWKSYDGWPDCWILQPWPITGEVPGRAPELYAVIDAAAEPVEVSSIDFNGTGAKLPDRPPADPPGTHVIFDGRSFTGWTQSGCQLVDDAVVTANHETGCTLTYNHPIHNVVLRLEFRMQNFADNGGIMIPHEIQLRDAGEWLTGGFTGNSEEAALVGWAATAPGTDGGGDPAERIKTNTYPDWSQMEIVRLGARYIVRINGRTVTDYVDPAGDSGPYTMVINSDLGIFNTQYGVNSRFDTTTWNPTVTTPDSWGNVWYRNIRLYTCTSITDPACTTGPGVNG